jgi:hypothetical protein
MRRCARRMPLGSASTLRSVSDRVSRPSLRERPAAVANGIPGYASSKRRGAVPIPRASILADRYDRSGLAVDEGCVTAASVISAVCGHCTDRFTYMDMVEQLR